MEELLLSSRHCNLFLAAYTNISFWVNGSKGLTMFPLISGIPVKPSKPVPRDKLIKKVSITSSLW